MNSTLHGATAEYIEAVRDALADQPASEVEEVIDDITEHMGQVVAELGGDPPREAMEERLGTPQQYADELRTAAGLMEPGETLKKSYARRRAAVTRFVVTWLLRLGVVIAIVGALIQLGDRWNGPSEAAGAYILGLVPVGAALLLWLGTHRSTDSVTALRQLPDVPRVEAGISALRSRPWGRAAVEFVESLRSAWWLLRAWLVTQALILTAGIDPVFPIDPSPIAVVILLGAIITSVWWGRRAVAGLPAGWPTRASRVGNFVLTVTAPALLLLASPGAEANVYDGPEVVYENVPQTEGIFHQDGAEILNFYVYGPEGRLVEGARIYDQDGRPVENVAPWEHEECLEDVGAFPGSVPRNVFPRPTVVYETDEPRCVVPAEAAPFGAALPGSVAEQQLQEAEVDRGTGQDSDEPDTGETPSPGGRSSQPDTEPDPTREPG